jgi:catechol 2,3-dioxygenase-like lactoylglutathione lyase family enzyme
MTAETKILHIALTYNDKEKADIFFNKILGISFEKEITLEKEMSKSIFGVDEEVKILVYSNEEIHIEIFISDKKVTSFYDHICFEISNFEDFVNRCAQNNITPLLVKKGSRTLIFVRDFSGYLFEIKEKK